MLKKFMLLLLLLTSVPISATSAWYLGTINRVWPNAQDGGFVITFSGNSSLSDCKHGYAYFLTSQLQPEILKNSLSVALSAFHAGSSVGVIIDKALHDGSCLATGIDLRK
ncbi:hypothetical protein [uncultured Shewanella sp.]|uniref:hypothetical protein n=1 Tax=uncultured Shewanella sp. TaxID=173975 RepID=UPI0026054443|nr:hypothetical protein [uncultured Shewanella sp.]